MNLVKNLAAVALVAACSFTAQASLINVGGVQWDPDYADGGETDFSMSYDFTQWYSTTNAADNNVADMQTSYSAAVGINTVSASLNGSSSLTGYVLSGVGETYKINGNNSFCAGCELTLAFSGLKLRHDNTFDFSEAWINLYVDQTPDYSHPTSNVGEVAAAMDGLTWISASFTSFGLASGTVSNGLASASIQITGGMAAANFLNSDLEGFALQSASAFFNTLNNGKYSQVGNGQVISDTIPEPSSIAILGLGLLGLAGAARRKQAK